MKAKKGQAIFVGMMIAIMVMITVFVLIEPLKDTIDIGRGNMDCDNTSISVGQKASCIIIDFSLFYFVGMCIAAGIGYVFLRRIQNNTGE